MNAVYIFVILIYGLLVPPMHRIATQKNCVQCSFMPWLFIQMFSRKKYPKANCLHAFLARLQGLKLSCVKQYLVFTPYRVLGVHNLRWVYMNADALLRAILFGPHQVHVEQWLRVAYWDSNEYEPLVNSACVTSGRPIASSVYMAFVCGKQMQKSSWRLTQWSCPSMNIGFRRQRTISYVNVNGLRRCWACVSMSQSMTFACSCSC